MRKEKKKSQSSRSPLKETLRDSTRIAAQDLFDRQNKLCYNGASNSFTKVRIVQLKSFKREVIMNNEEEHENTGGNEVKKSSKGNSKMIIVAGVALVVGLALGGLFFNFAPGIAGLGGNGEEEVAINGEGEVENGFEEAKPQLEEQLAQEKEQELMMAHLDDLKAESDIEKSLEVIGEGDEDAAIATVNDEEIKKKELMEVEQEQIQQMEMQGMDPEDEEVSAMLEQQREQTLEELITQVVLEQKVEEEGITVSDEDIEEEYQQVAQQFGGEEQLEQQIEAQGLSSEDLKEEIADHLPTQKYLENYIDENIEPEELEFTEEELEEEYERQQEQIEQQEQMEIEMQ